MKNFLLFLTLILLSLSIYSIDYDQAYHAVYPNGDIYFLTGNLEDDWETKEYKRFSGIEDWLNKNGFRVILNRNTNNDDLLEAVTNPNTTAIIWSSHANKSGVIICDNKQAVPQDMFEEIGPRLKLIILSNCNGEKTIEYYDMPAGVTRIY